MSNIFHELKRRNVFRVGVAYIVVAWLIIQFIETVSDPLSLPEWTEAFFIVVLLAGLPLILLFSWAFEITPDGLKKTEDVSTDESVTATTGKKPTTNNRMTSEPADSGTGSSEDSTSVSCNNSHVATRYRTPTRITLRRLSS